MLFTLFNRFGWGNSVFKIEGGGGPSYLKCTLSEQMALSTVDLYLNEISEFPHGRMMNKFLLHWTVHIWYKSKYIWVNRSTYTHKIQPLRIQPIGPIAPKSVRNHIIETVTDSHNGTNRENTVKFCQWFYYTWVLVHSGISGIVGFLMICNVKLIKMGRTKQWSSFAHNSSPANNSNHFLE